MWEDRPPERGECTLGEVHMGSEGVARLDMQGKMDMINDKLDEYT